MDNYGPITLKHWRSVAHANGWVYGLESLLQNYHDTYPDKWTTQDEIDEKIKDCEKWIDDSQKLIDEIEGSDDHKNKIQTLCKEIERLNRRIAELENEEFDEND